MNAIRRTEGLGRPRVRLVVLICALALVAGACGGSSESKPDAGQAATPSTTTVSRAGGSKAGPPDGAKPTDGGGVVMAIEAEPEGIDPTRYALSESGHAVASAVFDPLTTLDGDGNAVPYLAKSVVGTNENKTWTIELPRGVKFHDGSELTADLLVKNFEAYRASYVTKLGLQTVTTIEATDATHVVVQLVRPWAEFPLALTSQFGYVVPQAMIDNPELGAKPVGTGPFIFDSHTGSAPNQTWKFKKNPNYWRAGLPHLNAISFDVVPDNNDRLAKLKAGDIDLLHTYQPQLINTLRADPEIKKVENVQGSEDFFLLNTQAPPFDNINARRAVVYSTDSPKWVKEQMLGVEQPADSPFAPGQPGHSEDSGYPKFDMAKAKEAVKAYTAETGKPLEFQLIAANELAAAQEYQYFTTTWTEAGMKTTLKQLPQINLIASSATGAYQMARFRNFSFPNPDVDTIFWLSTSIAQGQTVSLNMARHDNPKIDELAAKALASTDPEVRDQAYRAMAKIWGEDLPYVWMGRPTWMLAADPKVNGIYAATNGTIGTIGGKPWIAELWVQQ